jgi:hypothetical protein
VPDDVPVFPRYGWILVAAAAALAAVAVVASRFAPDVRAIGAGVACAAVGAMLAWLAYRLASRARQRLPMLASGLLLSFLCTAVAIAFFTALATVMSPHGCP